MAGTSEISGYCAHHRTVFTWRDKPKLAEALCPIIDRGCMCGLPLVKRPRAGSAGRHAIVAQQPITRERLPLVVREVTDDGQA